MGNSAPHKSSTAVATSRSSNNENDASSSPFAEPSAQHVHRIEIVSKVLVAAASLRASDSTSSVLAYDEQGGSEQRTEQPSKSRSQVWRSTGSIEKCRRVLGDPSLSFAVVPGGRLHRKRSASVDIEPQVPFLHHRSLGKRHSTMSMQELKQSRRPLSLSTAAVDLGGVGGKPPKSAWAVAAGDLVNDTQR